MSRVVNKWWFTSMEGDTIGIIKVHDDITEQDKFYIGKGQGINEQADIESIRAYGSKFAPDTIK